MSPVGGFVDQYHAREVLGEQAFVGSAVDSLATGLGRGEWGTAAKTQWFQSK